MPPADSNSDGYVLTVVATRESTRGPLAVGAVLIVVVVPLVFWVSPSMGWRNALIASSMTTRVLFAIVSATTGGVILMRAVRAWMLRPLIVVHGDELSVIRTFGRLILTRADVADVRVIKPYREIKILEIRPLAIRPIRVGFQPAGTTWEAVAKELTAWRIGPA